MEESSDDTGIVSKIEARINDALDEIAALTGWDVFKNRDTFNTQVGVPTYNMPAGLSEIIQLRYPDTDEPITFMTIQEAVRRRIDLESSGRATIWLDDGVVVSGSDALKRIRLAPVPASIVTIEREYYFDPATVASASHIPVQDHMIVLIKDRVRAYMLENDGRYQAADRAQRRYEGNLTRMMGREHSPVSHKVILQEVDLAGIRGRRGPRLPSNYPDS